MQNRMGTTQILLSADLIRISTVCHRSVVSEGCRNIARSRLGRLCVSLRIPCLHGRRLCGMGCWLLLGLSAMSNREALLVRAVCCSADLDRLWSDWRDAASCLPGWRRWPRRTPPLLRCAGVGLELISYIGFLKVMQMSQLTGLSVILF